MVVISALEQHEERPIDSVGDDEWTAMPRRLVIDSGVADAVAPADWFSSRAAKESEGGRSGAYYATADGAPVYNEGQKTLWMATPMATIRDL